MGFVACLLVRSFLLLRSVVSFRVFACLCVRVTALHKPAGAEYRQEVAGSWRNLLQFPNPGNPLETRKSIPEGQSLSPRSKLRDQGKLQVLQQVSGAFFWGWAVGDHVLRLLS